MYFHFPQINNLLPIITKIVQWDLNRFSKDPEEGRGSLISKSCWICFFWVFLGMKGRVIAGKVVRQLRAPWHTYLRVYKIFFCADFAIKLLLYVCLFI